MTANAVRLSNSRRHDWLGEAGVSVLCGCGALLVVGIGVLGLMHAAWPRQILETWINIHALFGLLLCCVVMARHRWCVAQSPGMLPEDTRELFRHLSRIVYLSLYAVLGVRFCIGIVDVMGHGGAIDFNLIDESLRRLDRGHFNEADCRQFLASGVAVIVIIRVLAFRSWLRSREQAVP